MKLRIKEMNGFIKFITFNSAMGITLAPFGIYLKKEYLKMDDVITHEKIHWEQQMEMLIIFFYIWYLIEWFFRIFINIQGSAYRNISFEREAYDNDETYKHYLIYRKRYAWLNYLKKKK